MTSSRRPRFDAVLFDLDGTLLDTLDDLGGAANRVLRRRGFPTHSIESYRVFIGDGARVLVGRALPREYRDARTVAECFEDFRRDYARNWAAKTRPYPGIPELLDALVARGTRLAVLSNKPHPFTKLCVEGLLPRWSFGAVLGQRDGVPHKPDPAGAFEAAKALGVAPARVLYLGDSSVDMRTATAAGMFPAGVLWGFRPLEDLQRGGARKLLRHPMEAAELV